MSKGKASVLEQLKAEINAQSEGQEEIIEFSFQSITIEKFTPEIANLFSKYDSLISLEFNQCGIKSLDGFPQIKGLIKLCLEENHLTDNAINYIVDNFNQLQFLSLSGNRIEDLKTLKSLSKLGDLVQLDLQDNPVASKPEYRNQLFNDCPKLEILDNKDKEGNEVEYSDDEGDDEDDEDAYLDEDITDEDDDYDDDDDDEDEEPQPKKKGKK